MSLTFGSVCSGIEAVSVAWHPLGWRALWLAEIEPFPCAVLAHHYPDVPNLGDMTKIARAILLREVKAPDVLAGGTPCQAYSVAGLREGLNDARGQLTLSYVRLFDAIDYVRGLDGQPPAICVWENVPGVLSDKTNAFGCLLAGLAGEDVELRPPGKKWANVGCVFGPKRAVAWRVLDAQYFGVAQRRRRVFVVASARKDFDPVDVLFEFDGMRRDIAPSREEGQDTAGTFASRAGAGGFLGTDEACSGYVQPVARTLLVKGNNSLAEDMDTYVAQVASTGDVSHCLNAGGMGRQDFETETLITEQVRAVEAVRVFDPNQVTSPHNRSRAIPEICHTLPAKADAPVAYSAAPIAFSSKDYGNDATYDLAPTMRAMGHTNSHPNAGGQLAVAFQDRFRGDDGRGYGRVPPVSVEQIGTLETVKPWNVCVTGSVTHTLKAEGFDASEDGTGRGQPIVPVADTLTSSWHNSGGATGGNNPGVINPILHGMRVRRLTPVECERLQGFPAGYTAVPWGREQSGPVADGMAVQDDASDWHYFKPTPDGPRYKSLGNSMAVPVMHWIGTRINSASKPRAAKRAQ